MASLPLARTRPRRPQMDDKDTKKEQPFQAPQIDVKTMRRFPCVSGPTRASHRCRIATALAPRGPSVGSVFSSPKPCRKTTDFDPQKCPFEHPKTLYAAPGPGSRSRPGHPKTAPQAPFHQKTTKSYNSEAPSRQKRTKCIWVNRILKKSSRFQKKSGAGHRFRQL